MPAAVLFPLLPPLCCNKNDAKMRAKQPVDCHFYSFFLTWHLLMLSQSSCMVTALANAATIAP